MKDLNKIDKEKMVRELVDTFNDKDELHIAYKKKMKGIITLALVSFIEDANNEDADIFIDAWVNDFVEKYFNNE